MDVEMWPIGRPIPYENNPRRNASAVAGVVKSIRQFGFRQPIVVDEKGVVIVGHTRLLAAKEIGLDSVPVHVAEGLSEAQARAYRIADNRTGDEAEWDFDAVARELALIRDEQPDLLPETAFNDLELERYLSGDSVTDPHGEWKGMPEFVQPDASAFRHVVVHFKDQAAVDEFCSKLGVDLSAKIRYLWYPRIEIEVASDKEYGT